MRKRCPSCEQLLDATAFGRNRALKDGLSFYCKEVRDLSWVPDGFRWCPQCKQAVAHEDYTRNARSPSGFGGRCKACDTSASNDSYFLRTYGLTRNQVAELRANQGDRCAICGEASPQPLDHDHATGTTRQLLCQRCNQGLGLLRDDPVILR